MSKDKFFKVYFLDFISHLLINSNFNTYIIFNFISRYLLINSNLKEKYISIINKNIIRYYNT